MELLDGVKVRKEMEFILKDKLVKLEQKLGLVVIQIGDNAFNDIYVKQKRKMAVDLGYELKCVKLSSDVKEEEVLEIIDRFNVDDRIHGILVQMPIPFTLNEEIIKNRISPLKDVDGLTYVNVGKLVHGIDCLVSCTALGIVDLLKYYSIKIEGSSVVIVGRSNLVGKPVCNLLLKEGATVTMCHSKTRNLKEFTKRADILIVAVGIKKIVTADMVKEGAVVVDVGINRDGDKIVGDVDFDKVKDKVSYITPVPGGVGPMTVIELGMNLYKAYRLSEKIK